MHLVKPDIFVDQSATELIHTVVEGELDISQFHVLTVGEIISNFPEFKIIGRIIGASHLITFEIGDKKIHEIFACYDYKTSGKRLASYGPLGSVQANVELCLWNKVNYSFHSRLYHNQTATEKWLGDLEKQAQIISEKDNQKSIGLIYNFPENEFSSVTPKTIVVAENDVEKKQVNITTAHSYPNEQNIVKSESILKFLK